MDNYLFVPMTALGCYLIILITLLYVKRTSLKKVFLGALSVYIMWTLGSVCMRLSVLPSLEFWFHVSLSGLYLIPSATLLFMEKYMYDKFSRESKIWCAISIVAYVLNVVTGGWMIPAPNKVVTDAGIRYVYEDIGVQSVIPYVSFVIISVHFVLALWRGVKRGALPKFGFYMVSCGELLLLLGNLLILVPAFSGFPVDMMMGIPDAFTIMIMVGMSPKINKNRERIRKTNAIFQLTLSLVITLFFMFSCISYYENTDYTSRELTLRFCLSTLIFFILTQFVISKLMQNLFIRDGEMRLLRMNEFQQKLQSTLDIRRIHNLICRTSRLWLEAEWAEFFIWDEAQDAYALRYLQGRKPIYIEKNNALLEYIKEKDGCIDIESILPLEYDARYAPLIRRLKAEHAALIQPFYRGDFLYGVLVIARGKRHYYAVDRRNIEVLADTSMDAIRNAELYHEVYMESRRDELTGVGNRKRYYEVVKEIQEAAEKQPVSMLMVKLDDLRLCNRLYGTAGGDNALLRLVEIILSEVPDKDRVFRYGVGEFILLLPRVAQKEAREMAERIRFAVMKITDITEKTQLMLTASVGVCTVPESAMVDEAMQDNCGKALYTAQRNGKNCTVVYGEQVIVEGKQTKNKMFKTYEEVFRALTSAIDAKDHYTADHSENVSYYAMELARELKLSTEEVEIVKEAGLLHDIGKIGIPEAILQKPNRLNGEELAIMKTHVNQAIDILHHLSGMEYLLPAILGHHERYDGGGYPRGIAGENIPMAARILALADSFDAMTTTRPYRPKLSVEYAIDQILQGSGTQFDPVVAKAFVTMVEHGRLQIRETSRTEGKREA